MSKSKKEIVSKIMDEYSKYGLSRIEVEISYILAILWRTPKESIYPGMKMIFNKVYGIHDDTPADEAGIALFNAAISETKKEYPNASNEDIAKAVEIVGIENISDSLEDINFSFLNKVKETMMDCTKKFIKNNK